MKDKLKECITKNQYKEAVEILKNMIKEYIINKLQEENQEFVYTNILDLDRECQMHFKDKNIVKKVFYEYDDLYIDDEEKLENLMEVYKDLVKIY